MAASTRSRLDASSASQPGLLGRRRILKSRNKFWRSEDLPGSRSTAQHVLTDLARSGQLRRVRKGLYWRGQRTPLGMSPPPAQALIATLAGTSGVGPAGLSAAHELRLSTQVPKRQQVAVPERPPADIGHIHFVSRANRRGRVDASLRPIEVALLEALNSWEQVLEVPQEEAWARLTSLVADGKVRASNLAKASDTEPAKVRIRLRNLLDSAGEGAQAMRIRSADPRVVA
jgi:hypothetical protein